jgi:hypothetical protein
VNALAGSLSLSLGAPEEKIWKEKYKLVSLLLLLCVI